MAVELDIPIAIYFARRSHAVAEYFLLFLKARTLTTVNPTQFWAMVKIVYSEHLTVVPDYIKLARDLEDHR